MMRQPDCDFCRIAAGEVDARVVLRTDDIVAFFPLAPATVGHTLVVPVEHVADVWGLNLVTAERLAAATLRVSAGIRAAFAPAGMNIIQSNGEAATQTVPHLHVHLVPRNAGDAMTLSWPEASPIPASQQHTAWLQLRGTLDR